MVKGFLGGKDITEEDLEGVDVSLLEKKLKESKEGKYEQTIAKKWKEEKFPPQKYVEEEPEDEE